ncbi:MAG: hypothetical protein IPM01_12415 [Burkholderiaceae bacterium]|nr:hypothetical protein [Burkholderiaceae bacterium]
MSQALGRVSRGESGPPWPERGPTEIAALNRRFNRMVSDLTELESDRAVALAGISHDIRTPLTRLRMEIELSPMAEADKESMSEDITRIDAIVGKFMEYARTAAGDRQPGRIQSVVVEVMAGIDHAYPGATGRGDLALAVDAGPRAPLARRSDRPRIARSAT